MDAWRGSRKSHDEKRGEIHHDDEGRTTMTMKRKMDENDAGADEVMYRGIRAEPSRRAGGQVRWSYEEGSGPSRAEEPEAKSREQPPTFCSLPTPFPPLFFSGWVILCLKAGTAGGRTKFRPIWSVFRISHRRSSCKPFMHLRRAWWVRPLERGAKPLHTSRIPSGMLEVCGGWLQSTNLQRCRGFGQVTS